MGKDTFQAVLHQPGHLPSFREKLITWGRENFRPFPWRLTEDPYCILIAEILLHRTQSSQVIPIYMRFIERYPDLASLALATREELHRILYSLGLRWRIDLVTDMVSQLVTQFDSQIPHEKTELLSLPGVSDYVASAVRCFAWNLPEAIIDTNTVRVTGRIYNIAVKDSSRRNAQFRSLVTSLLDTQQPRAYNYALLDLAAKVCTKVRPPACELCPVVQHCQYGNIVLANNSNSETQ